MKNFKLINLLLVVAASLLLVNCTTDPIPGPDGIDGVDGVDGVSGTAESAACHSVAKSEEVHASYLFSGHYNENMDHDDGPLSQYANRNLAFGVGITGKCAACHTNDGYIDWKENGVTPIGDPAYPENISQTITCTTCHGKHTSFDFETDGFDSALRDINPVVLEADNSVTLDYGDQFTSHLCASCHQPRSTFAGAINDDGTVNVSGRFGPHYGAQSTLLEGIQGAELDGYTYDGANGTAAHRAGSSCTQCHMGASTGNNDGLHTKKWTETSCTGCHQNGVPADDFLAEGFKNLENLLLAEGILEIDEDGEVSIISGTYDLIPAAALWNYRMIYYDHSHGVHNPEYAKDLINNSIESLSAN